MKQVVITGAGRGFGRLLAGRFAQLGATVHLSARTRAAAAETAAELDNAHAYECDLTRPESIRDFARAVAERTDKVDILVNNGARYLDGEDLTGADDDVIIDTIASGATGTILVTKHFRPLLHGRSDIVNLVSACGVRGFHDSSAHPAYFAAKNAQAGFADIMSRRLRDEGIRVISLYPHDFDIEGTITARSVADCVMFAVNQPRDCFIRSFHFEPG